MNRHPRSAPPSVQSVADRVVATVERFLHVEAASGIALIIAAVLALLWANSPLAASYHALWHVPLGIQAGTLVLSQPVEFWINDGLMTIFFLLVGLEIRREMHEGTLANLRSAALPLAGALGGVAVPAALYLLLSDGAAVRAGWAVPTATDIAFAVGVLALLGKGVPASIRVLLLAIAVIDDIVAIVVIAMFYSDGIAASGLLIAAGGVLLVLGFQRAGVRAVIPYLLPGAVIWFGLLQSGVHPTLAGVVLGLLTPATRAHGERQAPVTRIETALHPWVAYGVMPLFALANAGIALESANFGDTATLNVAIAVAVALVIGKPLGILGGSWLAVRLGWCTLPADASWRAIAVIGCLGGIGFTMAIFIATLAFPEQHLLNAAKLGVLVASTLAGILGLVIGRRVFRAQTQPVAREELPQLP